MEYDNNDFSNLRQQKLLTNNILDTLLGLSKSLFKYTNINKI